MTDSYRRPSFWRSMGSVLDVFGVFREHDVAGNAEKADAQALYNDFRAVGVDLTEAMSQYETERNSRRK